MNFINIRNVMFVITLFLPRDFLGYRYAKRGSSDQARSTRRHPPNSKKPRDGSQSTFPGIWGGLTKFDQI